MQTKLHSFMSGLLLNLIALALVLSIVVYRTDLSFAQGSEADTDTPVLTPR